MQQSEDGTTAEYPAAEYTRLREEMYTLLPRQRKCLYARALIMHSTRKHINRLAPLSPTTTLPTTSYSLVGFSRVLISFKITLNGTLVAPSPRQLRTQNFADLEVVGVTGTIMGKEGMFAQCGWFGDNDLDWMWIRICEIKHIAVRSDLRFRRG